MLRIFPRVAFILSLLFALCLTGCSSDSGDDSEHSSSCTRGSANCACTADRTCNLGLSCVSGVCIDPHASNDAGYNDVTIAPPDCVELVPLRQWESDPSAVAMLFTAEDCATGEVFSAFNEAAFAIEEDGQALSSEAVPRILPSQGLRGYVTLLLDMSGSTLPNLAELQAGARRFVDEILVEQALDNVYISLQAFDGSPTPIVLENPSRDAQKLKASIDALTDFSGPDISSTNLYGATRQRVQNLQAHQQRVMDLNYDGVVTSGYLVLFTDGGDTAGREDADGAQNAVANARVFDSSLGAQPTVRTIAVGLRGQDYDPAALRELVGGPEWIAEADLSELGATFARVGRQIGRRIKGTYLLAYCSASRAGDHTVTLQMATGESNKLSFEFNASGFGGGCSAQFFETACETRSCGGFNCGACEDESEDCAGRESGRCVSACIEQDMCSGERITNELGYEQVCSFGEDVQQCSGQCVDTLANDNHCGDCNNRCQTLGGAGERCVQGDCVCEGGGSVCEGSCKLPSFFESDNENCGTCGNTCQTLGGA